jgi:pimeloyl-ACP methyl ester carboxylesterase
MLSPIRALLLFPVLALAACSGDAPGADPAPGCARETIRETRAVDLDTGSGRLAGTVEIPAGCAPHTVALIHAGSGPTDRDGNSKGLPGKNDSLKLLAEALAGRGIASLRYDKRGIAGSAAAGPRSERDLRFSTYVEDATRWLDQLAGDPAFGNIVAIGHSEGSLVEMQAVGARPDVALVSLAGAGRKAGVILREQLARQATGPLLDRANQIIAELEAGREVTDIPAPLASLFRPSVQPYLIDWFSRDPAEAIRQLKHKPLIVQGSTDVQVAIADAQALAAARPDGELAIIEGMNHVLKLIAGDLTAQLASYSDPTLPLHPELADRIARFVKSAFD